MESLAHILVPYDGSQSSDVALKTAISLSKRVDGKVSAVYVKRTEGDEFYKEIAQKIEERSAESGQEILFIHPTGKMYKEVVRTVGEIGADLVIMGTHGSSGFEEFWIGSNAYRVVSSSDVPVITMQEHYPRETFQRIIVPIDNSKETRQKIPTVSRLAQFFGAEVHLFGTSKYDSEDSQNKVKTYAVQSQKLLSEDEVKSEISYRFGGNIAKATLDRAEEIGADLVIMMSESEPSSGLFMGSNAQQVVNHSRIPVMTLHPKQVGIAITGY